MKNIFLTQGIYNDTHNSLFFKTDINWIIYAQKLKFNIIQINSVSSLNSQKVHGIIFSGGNDLFELSRKPVNLIRDKLEKKIIRFAIKKKIPCLFVCRGMQLLAKINKLNLKKDRNKFHVNNNHKISFEKKTLNVNSFHNYVVNGKNKNIITLARTIKDQTIEMFEHKKYNFLAMMFHPERISPDQKKIDQIIKNFFKL